MAEETGKTNGEGKPHDVQSSEQNNVDKTKLHQQILKQVEVS